MAIQDTAFKSLRSLEAAARNAFFVAFTHTKGEDGMFHFASYELDQRVVEMNDRHNAAYRAAQAATGGGEVEPLKVPAPRKERADGEVPITSQIRQWVAANPEATRKDAQAHFASVNPSTVSVQFGKARKGEI